MQQFHLGSPAVLALEATNLGGTSGPDLTRYFLVCGGLLLLAALLGFGFRRVVGRTLSARAAQRSLQVIDVLPLGGKQKLAVVRCYDRSFLLGLVRIGGPLLAFRFLLILAALLRLFRRLLLNRLLGKGGSRKEY